MFDRFVAIALGLYLASDALTASQAPVTLQQVSVQRVNTTGVFFQRSASSIGRRAQLRVLPDGRVELRSVSLVDLTRLAYGFEDAPADFVTSSAGAWTMSDRFNISATTEPPWRRQPDAENVPSELRLPIRRLLEDRFALEVRSETRSIPVYALRTARGGTAPALRPSRNECRGPFTEKPAGAPAPTPRCPLTLSQTRIVAGGATMPDFARMLGRTQRLDRVIVDDTGLPGTYDIDLTVVTPQPQLEYPESDFRMMLLRQALEAQLGLDLKAGHRPMPALVIERARRPAGL